MLKQLLKWDEVESFFSYETYVKLQDYSGSTITSIKNLQIFMKTTEVLE